MRDLIALTALPAIWGDFGPRQVADNLADVLVGTLGLELALVRVQGPWGDPAYEVVRTAGQETRTPEQARALAEAIAARLNVDGTRPVRTLPHPLGDGMLRVTTVPVGVGGDCGVIVAASGASGFPTEADRVLLNVAANQAAMVLQRRRADEEIRRSQRELTDFVENATVGLHWVGPDGRILWANRAELDLLGYTREEYVGRHIAEFYADRAAIDDVLRRLAANETLENHEVRMRCKDGSIRHVLINSNVRWEDGHFVHTRCFTRDITALKEAERERAELLLREQAARARAEAERDRLQQVIDALPEGIAIGDENGHVVMSNAAARAIWGQPPAARAVQRYGIDGSTRLDGAPCPPDEQPLARSIRHGEVVRGDQLLIRDASTGQMTPVLVNSAPLRDQRGRIVGGVAVFQDISVLKDLERQKDEFLAAASHDMKNPLANIKGRAQLLQRRAARMIDPEAVRLVDGLRHIDLAASRATTMIDELLDLTRLQMGRSLDLDRQPIDLVELARQVIAEYQPTTDRHAIELAAEVPSLEGIWDPRRLERVLANLLSNAVKYSPEGGRITIALRREASGRDDWAVLCVHDRGIGIPEHDLPRIFERFYRGMNAAGRIDGTGVGLAGARHIVELHGGTISVESARGRGSTFAVRLPLAHDRAGVPRAGEADPA